MNRLYFSESRLGFHFKNSFLRQEKNDLLNRIMYLVVCVIPTDNTWIEFNRIASFRK